MAYALDFIVGAACALFSIPLLMQLRAFTRYKRFLDEHGNPIDVFAMVRDGTGEDGSIPVELDLSERDEWKTENVSFPGRDVPPPNGVGWMRDDGRRRNFLDYLSAFYGVLLTFAAAALVISPDMPTWHLAWALFVGAGLIVGRLVPMLLRVICGDRTHPLTFIHAAFAATGVVAGLRLLN
jgi:hypothetical protein